MLDWITRPAGWIALVTLTLLEVVLGIDNVVFLSILVNKLPEPMQKAAMKKGLGLAVLPRVLLLLGIGWVISLNQALFTLPIPESDPELIAKGATQLGITGQDLVFILGGLFLLYKTVKEIHHKLEGTEEDLQDSKGKVSTFMQIVPTVLIINIVFSLDSVITAVGMVEPSKVGGNSAAVLIMILGVILSTLMMLLFAAPVARFVEKHPTVKMLALSFLILIAVNLLGEGFHQHIPKGYTYFSMVFAMAVESLNLRVRPGKVVELHEQKFED